MSVHSITRHPIYQFSLSALHSTSPSSTTIRISRPSLKPNIYDPYIYIFLSRDRPSLYTLLLIDSAFKRARAPKFTPHLRSLASSPLRLIKGSVLLKAAAAAAATLHCSSSSSRRLSGAARYSCSFHAWFAPIQIAQQQCAFNPFTLFRIFGTSIANVCFFFSRV